MKLFSRRSISLLACLAGLVGVPHYAAAAPIDGVADSQTVLAGQLVDQIEAAARAEPDTENAFDWLVMVAEYRFVLGRRAACVALLEQIEAEADKEPDLALRIDRLCSLADRWAVVEPARARRLIARLEKLARNLPKDADDWTSNLSRTYFLLGEYGRSFEILKQAADKQPAIGIFFYVVAAEELAAVGADEELKELAKVVRAIPIPDENDPTSAAYFGWKEEQIIVLARCRLPDEAAALFQGHVAAGDMSFDTASSHSAIVTAYVAAKRTDKAQAFLDQYLSQIDEESRHMSASAAAAIGDFVLVRELLADTSNLKVLNALPTVIVRAHQAGNSDACDELLARYRAGLGELLACYRAGLGRLTEEQLKEAEIVVECDLAMLEAAIGRTRAAYDLLPKLRSRRGVRLREMLIDLILREQKRNFGPVRFDALNFYLGLPR